MLHLYAALSQKERALISSRTREALAAMKRRGDELGNPSRKGLKAASLKGAASTKATSDTFAASVLPMIEGYAAKGLTVRQIAVDLNKRGVGTSAGQEDMRALTRLKASTPAHHLRTAHPRGD